MPRYEYDTEAIRRDARKINRLAAQIAESAIPELKKMQSRVDGSLEGRTADAMIHSAEKLRKELEQRYTTLSSIGKALSIYADKLEEADRRAEQIMRGK